jgi:hypothetical protein
MAISAAPRKRSNPLNRDDPAIPVLDPLSIPKACPHLTSEIRNKKGHLIGGLVVLS